jgi:hypothetical protein
MPPNANPGLAGFHRKDCKTIERAQRITVPITVHTADNSEICYEPGDWVVIREAPYQHVSFVDHNQFIQLYDPTDQYAEQVMYRDDFDLVVNEHKPAIPVEDMRLERRYFVCMKRKSPLFASEGWIGFAQPQHEPGQVVLQLEDSTGTVVLANHEIAFVLPLDPETEPCLLSSKGLTAQENKPKPNSSMNS